MENHARSARERWTRFEAWEIQQLRERPLDFTAALEWLSDAWDLASRMDPAWNGRENAERDWRHHAQDQRDLARAFR